MCSFLLLGTATALKIRIQSLLGDIREFRHLKKKSIEDGAKEVIDVPERFLADLEDPMLEENAGNLNLAGQLEDFGELMRKNQADEEDITMRENEGQFLQPPEDRSDDFFGAPPAPFSESGETAAAPAQGLFDDDRWLVPPVDVTVAANNVGAEAAAPDAPLRTNGIANPEDAVETPAVGEADGQAGGRRRPRKRPPPPTFSDMDETEIAPPIPDAQAQPEAATPPPLPDAQPHPEDATPPPDNEARNAPVSEGNEGPVSGIERREGGDFELQSVEPPESRRPKNKKSKKRRFLGGPMIDHAGNMQVNIKANQETGDDTLFGMQDVIPQKQFPSVKMLFATAGKKCGRTEISTYYGMRARGEERVGAADEEAEPADIAMDVDAPLGQSDEHDEPRSRIRAGTSADSLAGESASIQVQDLGVSGIETSMLNPILEEAAAAETPVVERSLPQPQEEMNAEEEVDVVPPPPISNDAMEDHDAEMMPPPAHAPGAGSVRSEVSDADSLPSGAFEEMGPIEREVMAALGDMGHGGRIVPFDNLVDNFNEKKSVARVFGLLLSMDKRRVIEMEQEKGAGFGGAIGIRKMVG